MKKLIAILLALVLMLSLCACGSKEESKTENKTTTVTEESTAKTMTDTLEQNEDGTYVWPADQLPEGFPVFSAALTKVSSANKGFALSFKTCDYDTAAAYVDELVAAGWGEKDESLYDDLGFSYYGSKDGSYIKFQYMDSDKYMTERQIRVTQAVKLTYSTAEINN